MTDQKMREALDAAMAAASELLMKSPFDVTPVTAMDVCGDLLDAVQEALASAQPEGPELTEEELIEKVTKAILFQDSGSTEDWEANSDLGEAAIAAYREAARALLATPSPAPEGHYTPSGRAAPDQREKVELTDAEYRRGFTDGYNQRDAEVRGALV